MSHLVQIRLVHQVSGLGQGMVVVLREDPKADLLLVHLSIFVLIPEVRELVPLSLNPVWFYSSFGICKHVLWNQGIKRHGFTALTNCTWTQIHILPSIIVVSRYRMWYYNLNTNNLNSNNITKPSSFRTKNEMRLMHKTFNTDIDEIFFSERENLHHKYQIKHSIHLNSRMHQNKLNYFNLEIHVLSR